MKLKREILDYHSPFVTNISKFSSHFELPLLSKYKKENNNIYNNNLNNSNLIESIIIIIIIN